MPQRFLGLAASAIGLLAFVACGSSESSGSTTSTTTATTSTTGTAAGGGGSGGSSTTSGSGGAGGGGGGGPACVTCAEAITPGENPNNLPICQGPSTDLYNALVQCTCIGACGNLCADNICMGADATPECQACFLDTAAGCGNEFNECSNDF